MTTALEELLRRHIQAGTIPGAWRCSAPATWRCWPSAWPPKGRSHARGRDHADPVDDQADYRGRCAAPGGGGLTRARPESRRVAGLSWRIAGCSPAPPRRSKHPPKAITPRHLLTNSSGYGTALVSSPQQARGPEAGPGPPTLSAQEWLTSPGRTPARLPTGRGLAVPPLVRRAGYPHRQVDRSAAGRALGR